LNLASDFPDQRAGGAIDEGVMSTAHCVSALAALIAAAALTSTSAKAQQFMFLTPPAHDERAPAYQAAPAEQNDSNEDGQIAPRLRRQVVNYASNEAPGTVIIDTPHTFLYFVLGNGKAIRYGIGVGRQGFTWSGVKQVVRKTEWPDWYPPADMIKRQPYLPRMVAGGPGNPLGARAMYIGGTEYRIHGTNDPSSIGKFVSSGCIRMTNDSAIDLYNRVSIGAKVIVLPMHGAPSHEAQVPGWQARAQAAIAASRPARTSWNARRPAGLY
jgi:lipoprotein-anchoring transpeptidase ErfK/SrfK